MAHHIEATIRTSISRDDFLNTVGALADLLDPGALAELLTAGAPGPLLDAASGLQWRPGEGSRYLISASETRLRSPWSVL